MPGPPIPTTPKSSPPPPSPEADSLASYVKSAEPGRRRWVWVTGGVLLLIVVGAFIYGYRHRPVAVTVAHPVLTAITETIASSGLVNGRKETVVGASYNGAVVRLLVKLGDPVVAGQALAVLKNNVTQAQWNEAATAVQTARAQLAVASRGALASELETAQMRIAEGRALADQAAADLTLARKTQERKSTLVKSGDLARSELDASTAALAASEAKRRSALASTRLAEAQLATLRGTPRKEDVEVARHRLDEAQKAWQVAQEQASEATIVAPFAGVIAALNTEVGQNVDVRGVVSLVSNELEVAVDLDESNLADLSLGQEAILSAGAFPDEAFRGRLSEISPAVNRIRGTVTVKLRPVQAPAWLRSGQTLNVNLITSQSVKRLLLPAGAMRRAGDRTVVLVVQGDRAVEKIVATRPPTAQGVPVLAGVDASDIVIVLPATVAAGDAVRVRR